MWKRRMGHALAAFAIAGLGVLGVSSPASAEAETVTYQDICGGVKITYTGEGSIEVRRDGVTIGTSLNETSLWGAAPGDVISVAGFENTHTHQYPQDCTSGDITVEFEHACQGILLLKVTNNGPGAAGGFVFEGDGVTELDSFPVGVTVKELQGQFEDYLLIRNTGTGDLVWYSGFYTEPRNCDSETVHATFSDLCGKVKLDITSDIEETQGALVVKNGTLLDIAYFATGDPFSKEYPAVAGDQFAVYYPNLEEIEVPEFKAGAKVTAVPEGFDLIAEHTHTPPQCDLPVTGSNVSTMALVGVLLIACGAGLYAVTRRRAPVTA